MPVGLVKPQQTDQQAKKKQKQAKGSFQAGKFEEENEEELVVLLFCFLVIHLHFNESKQVTAADSKCVCVNQQRVM